MVKERHKFYVDKLKNLKTTGGVHKKALPTFFQNHKQWWKLKRNYVEQPVEVSHHKKQQDAKFWNKNDAMLLSDFSVNQGPEDPLKSYHRVYKKAEKLPEKPNNKKNIKLSKNIHRGR